MTEAVKSVGWLMHGQNEVDNVHDGGSHENTPAGGPPTKATPRASLGFHQGLP